ncbi:Uncharacterized protein FWK35_00029607 [Aphis craccivora]|uniref:Uncharacterized protein n=1 Tax=Aphis craccivora TaxID=307492 RepID=A0A6G0VNZ3_APHCR|nr:Uncharacterized protein FWK35_00029607 [Aphis craccivora]
MNVFGSSRDSETKKFISNLEKSLKSYLSKLTKLERLVEENHKSVQIQENQTETLQITCSYIAEHLIKIDNSIHYITDKLRINLVTVNNKYMIKEMSVVDTDTSTMQHWIFKHSSLTQDAKSRSVNNWLQ